MSRSVRRIVTGHDREGKSIVVADGPPPPASAPSSRVVNFVELWSTQSDPAELGAEIAKEPTERPFSLGPGAHGSVLRLVDFAPEPPGATPRMHRTETLDYGIVLEGEIYMILDDSETLVRAGDIVVQRGTDHAWQNRSNAPCRMAFILLAGQFAPALSELLRHTRPDMRLVP